MTGHKTTNLSDAIRNLIVCDTQFGWNGETTLKLPELLDLQARGWLIEGDENNEFSLTDEGQAFVARVLQVGAPAELAEQQEVELPPLPRTHYNACGDGSEPLYTAAQMQDYARAALAARQPGAQVPEYIRDLHDVEQGLIRNPNYAPPAQGIALGVTGEEREWIDYAIAHMRDDSEPEDLTCANALESLLRRIDDQRDSAPGAGSRTDHLLERRNRLMNSYGNGDREDAALDEQIAKIDAELAGSQSDAAPGVGNG